jgi:hypothetical protein
MTVRRFLHFRAASYFYVGNFRHDELIKVFLTLTPDA